MPSRLSRSGSGQRPRRVRAAARPANRAERGYDMTVSEQRYRRVLGTEG